MLSGERQAKKKGESQAFEYRGDVRSLHGFRPSQANIDRSLFPGRLYAWYSGDTAETGKGVLMAYPVHWKWNSAWYVGFDKAPEWHLSKTVAVAPRWILRLLERAAEEKPAPESH